MAFLLAACALCAPLVGSIAEQTPGASPGAWIAAVSSIQTRAEERHTVAPVQRRLQRIQAKNQAAAPRQKKAVAVAPFRRVPTLHAAIDKPDITQNHKQIANEAIQLMPERCRSLLKNFYVRYDNPESRGLGGKTTIILTGNVSDEEFRALFIHEFGHLLDLGCLNGTAAGRESTFKDGEEIMMSDDPSVHFYQISWIGTNVQRAGSKPEDFVSGYASWDPFEDFAESFAYYMLQRDAFALRAQENTAIATKYRWFETYMPELSNAASGGHTWTGTVPWDVTKLPYAWNPTAGLARR